MKSYTLKELGDLIAETHQKGKKQSWYLYTNEIDSKYMTQVIVHAVFALGEFTHREFHYCENYDNESLGKNNTIVVNKDTYLNHTIPEMYWDIARWSTTGRRPNKSSILSDVLDEEANYRRKFHVDPKERIFVLMGKKPLGDEFKSNVLALHIDTYRDQHLEHVMKRFRSFEVGKTTAKEVPTLRL